VESCPKCGRGAEEIHYSHAVGGISCERCYVRVAPPVSKEARRWKPPRTAYEPPKPTAYAELVGRVWGRLEEVTQMPVFTNADGSGRIAAYCPVCRIGTLAIQFLDGRDPEFAVESSAGPDCCSYGCTFEQIVEALA
jgi:hypothetical protein